jgi:formylglycine-generating enzyme required for sulfatase activity
MKRGVVGRADLVAAFREDPALGEFLERQLQLVEVPRQEKSPEVAPVTPDQIPVPPEARLESSVGAISSTLFWRVVASQRRGEATVQETRGSVIAPAPAPKLEPLPFQSLLEDAAIRRIVQDLARVVAPGARLDIDRFVRQWARGRVVRQIPRQPRRTWRGGLVVVFDYADRLAAYEEDQAKVYDLLTQRLSRWQLGLAVRAAGDPVPVWYYPEDRRGLPLEPLENLTVLALTDLGGLERNRKAREAAEASWRRLGERLQGGGARAIALAPCGVGEIAEELREVWRVFPWGSEALTGREQPRAVRVERLLAHLSKGLRIEPRLLRAIRRELPEVATDPAVEAYLWQDPAFRSHHPSALTPRVELPREQQARFAEESPERQRHTIGLVCREHGRLYEGVWHAEVLNLGRDALALVGPDDVARAQQFVEQLTSRVRDTADASDEARDFASKILSRLTPEAWRANPGLNQLWAELYRDQPDKIPPEGIDPQLLKRRDDTVRLRRMSIRIKGDQLVFTSPNSPIQTGSWLGDIEVGLTTIEATSVDPAPVFSFNQQPSWVVTSGRDEYGPWCEFEVRGVRQRLRWIPPGKFLMGAPDNEPGFYNEGPQHWVTLTRGYWMFDTPCTQAMWEAVMGMSENRSVFRSADRPVEEVSWDEVQIFFERLKELMPQLEIGLPSEAQWEYACRAGTTTALYSGPITILGEHNAPALNQIAWYRGNSGVEFELTHGEDASHWGLKQFEFSIAGTHPVKRKKPNSWGLFDMLGNVLEWCQDTYDFGNPYSSRSRFGSVDPLIESPEESYRIVRGGAYNRSASSVRSAYRTGEERTESFRDVGFRCRVYGCEPLVNSEERRGVGGSGNKSHNETLEPQLACRETTVGRSIARVASTVSQQYKPVTVPRAAGPVVRVVSDIEELVLELAPRPSWAAAMGRDQYGLWADLHVPRGENNPPQRLLSRQSANVVVQRMRWIPPGRFMMGSPIDEIGRNPQLEFESHEVEIPTGFWLFDTPVTQELWFAVMGENPSAYRWPTQPVDSVNWFLANDFCRRISVLVSDVSRFDLSFLLPSEAEWEFACRAGTTSATYSGTFDTRNQNTTELLNAIAWHAGNSDSDPMSRKLDEGNSITRVRADQTGQTRSVGVKIPNAWGLFDMLGNVWEWCVDGWRLPDQPPPKHSDKECRQRVIRGGSWRDRPRAIRAAFRRGGVPREQYDDLGFRCMVASTSNPRTLSQLLTMTDERLLKVLGHQQEVNKKRRQAILAAYQERLAQPRSSGTKPPPL